MGLPYSKQIRGAFDQVTPLVAAGFEVLQTTKNISLLLLVIQILTVVLLGLILGTLWLLLLTANPDLEAERRMVVTPVVKWWAGLLISMSHYRRTVLAGVWILVVGAMIGGFGGYVATSKRDAVILGELAEAEAESQGAEAVGAEAVGGS